METTFNLFVSSILIGLSVAAPVGAIGVLVIRRTLAYGRLTGLFTGLGVATADATYGMIAALGLTAISSLLLNIAPLIRLFGGLFLLYLAFRTFREQPATEAAQAKDSTLAGAYGSAVLLTLTNPTTIISFVGIFAGMGLASTGGDAGRALLVVSGVFSGSLLWWFILTFGVSRLRGFFTPAVLVWVNRVSGLILGAFGLLALRGLFP